MAFQVLTTTAASITELKRDPMGTFHAGDGAPVAILNRNEPAFYCVPPALYAQLMELLEDEELGRMADERSGEKVIEVNIDDLYAGFQQIRSERMKEAGSYTTGTVQKETQRAPGEPQSSGITATWT